jgi:hypothetical protein
LELDLDLVKILDPASKSGSDRNPERPALLTSTSTVAHGEHFMCLGQGCGSGSGFSDFVDPDPY